MLSPSSPAQKNLGEEDSSGSDAGSELSLEPETDRFGFIVTNGSTAGSTGPPPELVRQREAKWINIIVQWDRILLKKTSKVKVQCQKGIPASLRAKCWPLLCGATDRMNSNEKLYETLDSQPALQSWVDVIERDLDRQFPFHEMFLSKDGHGRPSGVWCRSVRSTCLDTTSPLLEGVLFDAAMLTWVLKRTCPAAHKHLQHHGVEPLMFATDWLMCLFTRHLPFNTLLRVWDLFFCYGVRVLLQVAVVLVRRVLGRAEQRKQCPGQMETLEKLRGVREQVQDEDDAFIAEVCSVALSARDLEKHTEKELQKWRKDRPSSTFDPRGRCHGYRTVWARAQQSKEEQEKKEREKGNLSVPLARSASTLSLSPSILHKKLRKGGKANAGDWEGGRGGNKIERHQSMGAKEDYRNWSEFNFKKVQGVQEEEDVDEHKTQSEAKPAPQSEQKEPEKNESIQNIPTEQAEETVTVKVHNEQEETMNTEKAESQLKETEENKTLPEQTEQIVTVKVHNEQEEIIITEKQESQLKETEENKTLPEQTEETVTVKVHNEQEETIITEKEESQLKETEENKTLPEPTEETNVETEPTKSPTEDQTAENIVAQGEELDSNNQSQYQSNDQDTEVEDTNNETEKPEAESERTAAVEEDQTEIQTDADADTNTEVETGESVHPSEEEVNQSDVKPEESAEDVQQTPVGSVREVPATETETSQVSETGDEVEAPAVKDCTAETKQEEVIAETDRHSQGDTFEGKYHSTESLTETDMKEESHTQTLTDTAVPVQTQEKAEEDAATQDDSEVEIVQTDSNEHIDSKTEAETLILCPPDCIQPQEGTDLEADAEAEAETPVSNDTVRESSEAQCSEEESEATASEPTQEKEEIILVAHSEVENDQTQAADTEPDEEIPDSVAPEAQEAVTSAQGEEVSLSAEPDGMGSVEMSTTEEAAPEQPKSEDTVDAVEEKKGKKGNAEESTVGEDDVFISTEPTDLNADSKTQVQDKESCLVKDPTELNNVVLPQATGRRNSRSSGDFCVRKSSSSRGSRLGRRLSQDLFTVPQKTSQSTPDEPEVKHTESQSSTEALNPTKSPTKVTSEVASSLSEEATERTELQQEPLPANPPKRFGLFRRLKGERPKKGTPKMQVPKILIQDFSDQPGTEKLPEEEGEEKLSSRERRRRRRERERREKEEERLRKKREKELEKERERERRKPQTRGKSFQVQKEKGSSDEPQPGKTGPRMLRNSASYAESYF
ncbi:Carabin [Nibea albiflora]|uniref:Carabin n=1 Tax=Nibea albiflora TaxID=240163 RepID=A0ACB7ET53_NIBAL|nr:Carabin [Nibea albiflora]